MRKNSEKQDKKNANHHPESYEEDRPNQGIRESHMDFITGLAAQISLVVVFVICLALAFHYFGRDRYTPALWFGVAAWLSIGLGVAFHVQQYIFKLSRPPSNEASGQQAEVPSAELKMANPQQYDSPQVKDQRTTTVTSNDNQISDFRVAKSTGDKIEIEASYFYNGALGSEGVMILAMPLKSNGTSPPGSTSQSGGEVPVVGKKAMVRFELRHTPDSPNKGVRSSKIRLSMEHIPGGEFYFREFPYIKTWKAPTPTKTSRQKSFKTSRKFRAICREAFPMRTIDPCRVRS